jgi:flagellar hook-length control protein FliK
VPQPDADPVTLASTAMPVPGDAPNADTAPASIGRLVAAAVPQLRGSTDEVRLSVRLDPPSLGHVTVDISSRDGAVHVVVRPTEAATTDVLAAQRSAVDAALADAGFQLGGFDVRSNDRRDAPKPGGSARVALDDTDDITSPSDDGALRL